ncbi:putative oxidoreductase CipA [Xylariaceae sp. FL1019]|nr:putative oxidoreductase CipA [Xylariaceae sp. FL1019]
MSNYIKKVAIVGASGTVGKFIAREIIKKGKQEVTAITRLDSQGKIPEGAKVAKVSYDDPASLAKALEGHDALIITMAVAAPPENQIKLIEAAAAANVSYVIPNQWGIESDHGTLGSDTLMSTNINAARKKVEELGKSSWIAFVTGYWYSYSLSSKEAYGVDFKNRIMTFFDDGTQKINTITWEKTGRAVAALLSLPIKAETAGAPSISDYKNKHVYTSSWLMSQKDMFASVLKNTNTIESDWTIKHENSTERHTEAKKKLFAGDRSQFQRLLYARTFYPNDDGNFQSRHELDDAKLGIEGEEDLDAATKLAIQFAETGNVYPRGE